MRTGHADELSASRVWYDGLLRHGRGAQRAYDFAPLRHVMSYDVAKFFGFVAYRFESHFRRVTFYVRLLQDRGHVALHFVYDWSRRTGRREHTVPCRRFESRKTRLRYGGQRRHAGPVFQTADCDRSQSPRFDVRERGRNCAEHELDIPAHEIDHGGVAAFVGHVDDARARHGLEELHGQERGGTGAARAVRKLARPRFRERNELLHVSDGQG